MVIDTSFMQEQGGYTGKKHPLTEQRPCLVNILTSLVDSMGERREGGGGRRDEWQVKTRDNVLTNLITTACYQSGRPQLRTQTPNVVMDIITSKLFITR